MDNEGARSLGNSHIFKTYAIEGIPCILSIHYLESLYLIRPD